METAILNYTTINHEARRALGLSMNEYAIADLIYHLSNHPDSIGWCYASKEKLGAYLDLSKQSVHIIVKKLIEANLVEKNPVTRHLKTTTRWYNKIIVADSKESLPTVKKVYPDSKESLLQTVKKVYSPIYDNNSNNNNYTTKKSEDFLSVYLASFNEKFHKDCKPTSGRKRMLNTRIRSYSPEQILQALENLNKWEFAHGKNDRGWIADPDYLIRSDEQIDRFLNFSATDKKSGRSELDGYKLR